MSRYTDYKYAKHILKNIEEKPENYLIIHYSCEGMENLKGKSPRIASISVRQFNNAQTNNFSIHQYAEIIDVEISPETYKQIEKKLLEDFFKFVDKNGEKTWIHWNMRDNNFGFNALEHRFEVLGGTPTIINNNRKIDLGHFFKLYFGEDYIKDPHIKSLMDLNNFKSKNFLNGEDEKDFFDKSEYVKLSLSTSSKVNLFSSFITAATNNSLKTNVLKWKMRGTNISGLYSTFEESRLGKIIIGLVLMIIGGIIGAVISKMI